MNNKMLIIASALFVCISCNNPSNESCFGIFIDYLFPIAILDKNGNNLLHSRYMEDSIKIYYLFPDGCSVLCDRPSMDISKGFRMYSDVIEISSPYATFYHTHDGKDYSIVPSATEPATIYLEWNSQDTDTIQSTSVALKSTKNKPLPGGICKVLAYDKVYYNGNLIITSWENNQEKISQGIFPTIIKE